MNKLNLKYLPLLGSLLALLNLIVDFGYSQGSGTQQLINYFYLVSLLLLLLGIPLKYVADNKAFQKPRIWLSDIFFWLLFNLLLVSIHFESFSFKSFPLLFDFVQAACFS